MSAARQLSRHLKELRIHLCQTSSASKGAREFIQANYTTLKSANPEFPILIRECSGIQVALYLFILRQPFISLELSAVTPSVERKRLS
jgi:hypothetical protein